MKRWFSAWSSSCSWSLLLMHLALACTHKTGAADVRDDLATRGRYLVSHAAACVECHSPRRSDGSFDPERWLSGVDCFIDAVPENPNVGCVSTRNLSNHETGLKNRSDKEIKDMFLRGVRPDGKALHPLMPYAYFANMRERDADAIVAYLRTVPGVNHMVARNQPPFLPPEQPAARIDAAQIPMPRPDYPQREAALRGRYIAGEIGSCLDCHTPRANGKLALERAFQGGLAFKREGLRLSPPYPPIIYSANLTPHATGIAGYSVATLVRALKRGVDLHGAGLCPPMPAGPSNAFGGLSDQDASDIAHYLLSLAPRENAVPARCVAPAPHARTTASALPALADPTSSAPFWLSETGMYSDTASKVLAAGVRAFEPAYPLWSDGADKQRWLSLPAGTQIDSSDMDHWQFPVGTRLFKEFSRDGHRLETRVIARTGPGERDYWLGAFLWNEDESDARFVPDGARDVRGTEHDVPSSKRCETCHNGEPGRVLGFSAIQQPRTGAELLTRVPANASAPPGDARTAAALGYLHANCAHCHNPHGSAWPDTNMDLRLSVADRTLADTHTYRSTVGQAPRSFGLGPQRLLIAPGDPDGSALLFRMTERRLQFQMPPIGTDVVDSAGSAAIRAWIAAL